MNCKKDALREVRILIMGKRILLNSIFTLLIFSCSGCGFIPYYCGVLPYYAEGHKFKPQRVSELVKGSSTQQGVWDLFGKPIATSLPDPYKSRWWRYRYAYLGVLGIETAELEVSFAGNVVKDYHITVTNNRY